MPFHKNIHKIVSIRIQNKDKCRISIILNIEGDGSKLVPYAMFKGALNSKILKDLNKNKYALEERCIFKTNKNALSNNLIIIDLINKVYILYFTTKKVELKNTLLFLDHAIIYYSYKIK